MTDEPRCGVCPVCAADLPPAVTCARRGEGSLPHPNEEFAALPPAVQFELLQIAREAMSMSAGDKGHAAAMFATVGLHFGQRPESDDNDRFIPGALMVSALGVLLKVAHTHELTTKEIE